MSDRYNNRIAKLLAWINNSKTWAITISSKTTLYSCGFLEITAAWIKHEEMHKEQIRTEGWKFYVKYLWYNITRGYKNNPYEVR
jgi:predicted nuclease of restriction endonuclease-like RecB superfamily